MRGIINRLSRVIPLKYLLYTLIQVPLTPLEVVIRIDMAHVAQARKHANEPGQVGMPAANAQAPQQEQATQPSPVLYPALWMVAMDDGYGRQRNKGSCDSIRCGSKACMRTMHDYSCPTATGGQETLPG